MQAIGDLVWAFTAICAVLFVVLLGLALVMPPWK